MPARPGNVLVLELNEITWDLMDPLMRKGMLPNFRALVEAGARGEPWALETDEHLDPWVTWTSLYTGVRQEVHGLTMLEQDGETIGAKRIWEYLCEAGISVGLFGTANTWPAQRVNGWWIPGPFSRDFSAYPGELEPIQALNVGLTRGHTIAADQRPSLKKLLPKLLSLGLQPSTMLRLAQEMAQMKLNPNMAWRKVSLQPLVNFDFFARLYRQHRPTFATFHSNHVAYYQHRFWRAMDPTAFEVPPTEEEKAKYGGCIAHGYQVADEILGRLRRLAGPNVNLVVLSSCGQQPATGGRYTNDQESGNVGLQLKMKALLECYGVADRVRYSNLMAPQWKVDFDDARLMEQVSRQVADTKNVTRGIPAISMELEGKALCLTARRDQSLDDELEVPTPDGPRRMVAHDLLDRHAEVVKSGRHHPKGVLLMHGPGVKAGSSVDSCTNLDLAPTLMHLMGQPVPTVMSGRVLGEALTHPPLARTLVTAGAEASVR